MNSSYYRDYRVKLYLNAKHYIYINGNKGQDHPHTWEFSLYVRFVEGTFMEFTKLEKSLNAILEPYQNKTLNDLDPFNSLVPTLENMIDYYSGEFLKVIEKMDGVLLQVSASETPTRTCIVNFENNKDMYDHVHNFEDKIKEKIVENQLMAIINDDKYMRNDD